LSAAESSIRLAPAMWDDPDVRRLADAQQAELRARYDGGLEPGTPPSAADLALVLVARDDDGTAIGCGALRGIADGVGELKRMYVVPGSRGRGVARALLAALEEEARNRGWTTLRLETGPRQPEAIALYTGAGYRPTEAFGAYIGDAAAGDSLYFERALLGHR
jgi:GNAT superfamily N-acetyltransferase